jgi:hypothetical protein
VNEFRTVFDPPFNAFAFSSAAQTTRDVFDQNPRSASSALEWRRRRTLEQKVSH